MLLRELTPEDTRLQVRLAYNQVVDELSPAQQAEFPFDQVLNHAHEVVRQQRTLTLINDVPDEFFEATVSTDCALHITAAAVEGVMLVFRLINIPLAASSVAAKEIASLLGEKTISRFGMLIKLWKYGSKWDRARIVYQIFAGVVRATGLKKLYSIIRKSMHWYDWALMAVIIVAQVTAQVPQL